MLTLKPITITIFLTSILFLYTLNAQDNTNLYFSHVSHQDGLSGNNVTCIVQDRNGFLWIGTTSGLNRYDGYTILPYYASNSDTTSVCSNQITCLLESSDGLLWVGTLDAGISVFDPKYQSFTRHYSSSTLGEKKITGITEAPDGTIWVATSSTSIYRIDHQEGKVQQYTVDVADIRCTYQNKNQRLYIGGHEGLAIFDTKQKKVIKYIYESLDEQAPMAISYLWSITEDKQGKIWLGMTDPEVPNNKNSDRTLVCYDPKTDQCKRIAFKDQKNIEKLPVRTDPVYSDNNGNLWMGLLRSGLVVYNTSANTMQHFLHDANVSNSIGAGQVQAIYIDRSGTVWIGTSNGGLSYYIPELSQFDSWIHTTTQEQFKKIYSVTAVSGDIYGKLWVGAENGLFCYDGKELNKESGYWVRTALYCSNAGHTWAMGWPFAANLYQIDSRTRKEIRVFSQEGTNLMQFGYTFRTIQEDNNGGLWMLRSNGIVYHHPKHNLICHMPTPVIVGSENAGLLHLAFDNKRQSLWVYTDENKLYKARINADRRDTAYIESYAHINAFDNVIIAQILVDNEGGVWIGTTEGGVYGFNLKNTSEKMKTLDMADVKLSMQNGLPHNTITNLLEDKNGNIWFSTLNSYICKYDKATEKISSHFIRTHSGIPLIRKNAACIMQDGRLVFGQNQGVLTFHPDELFPLQDSFQITLTDFYIHNNKILPGATDAPIRKHISYCSDVLLHHTQNAIIFEYAATNYTYPENQQYEYMLEGLYDTWQSAGQNRRVAFTNLQPGKYVFRLRGTDQLGNSNTVNTIELPITITSPWWETWWAYLLYIITTAVVLYSFLSFSAPTYIG